jgi:hexosaminidase
MQKFIYFLLFVGIILFSGCQSPEVVNLEQFPPLIPKPQQLEIKKGVFKITENTTLFFEKEFTIAGEFLVNYIQNGSTFLLKNTSEEKATIIIKKADSLPSEGYTLSVSNSDIIIKAKDASGAFYAIQTLRQLMPILLEKQKGFQQEYFSIPQVYIKDAPKFRYRGMHLDVGRHFFPKEFIKEYIANLAMLKMNYFHWHLTEDQGWRIEIKKYPKLTEIGAYREETLIGHYNDAPIKYDGKKYGGFYTQEDIKEIVAFAKKHQVTIIPEIEIPGHSQAAISAYPELGCSGEQVPVANTWGVFPDIYCPNENTFVFLENVLTEVIDLFPGEYIHIGGDEAPKKYWKECDHCQKLIKDLDLKDEHGLQSYFISRIETFLNSKGKKIIGWDEILEGGLAPNATVMSWRGFQGAIDAAKEGHDVILTPGSHAYFDHYQSNNPDEPLAIGGFLPLKKVYSFNPIPPELSKEEEKHVLGAQGNVWTEYMNNEDQVEYMLFPRILAMSEVVWSGATKDMETEYPKFLSRVEPFLERLHTLNINNANHLYELEGNLVKENGLVRYQLKTPLEGKKIRYTTNGTAAVNGSKLYTESILITENTTIHSGVFKDNQLVSNPFSETINYHKAITGKVDLNVLPHKAYNAGGKEALINGIHGSDQRYGDKEWLGFWGDDVEITIDLGEIKTINTLKTRFYNTTGQWIYAPKRISVSCLIDGRVQFMSSKLIDSKSEKSIIDFEIDFSELKKIQAQIILITIPSYGIIQEGKQGAGNKAWTFIDEIIIE